MAAHAEFIALLLAEILHLSYIRACNECLAASCKDETAHAFVGSNLADLIIKLIKECGIYCIECLGTIDSQYPDCAFLFIQQHNEYHPFRIILYLAILILLCSPVIVKLGKAKIKEHSVFLSHCTH